jgi:hypothetical protein
MNEAMKIVREINIEAERFYDEAQKLGKYASDALTGKRRSQMTGLENVAENSLKTSDIFDYIKRQIARSKEGQDWRAPEKEAARKQKQQAEEQPVAATQQQEVQGFGERLNASLRKLEERRNNICKRIDIPVTDRWKRQDIHLRLIRQFIRQVVIQYEYVSGALQQEQEEEL